MKNLSIPKKPDAQTLKLLRVRLCKLAGFSECADPKCGYVKSDHLHFLGRVYFPEPYAVQMYPDYCADLNAVHALEETHLIGAGVGGFTTLEKWFTYCDWLRQIVPAELGNESHVAAEPWQRAIAIDRVMSIQPIV